MTARAVILLIALYIDRDLNRTGEFMECVRRNAANPLVEGIHMLLETADDPGRLRAAYSALACEKVNLNVFGRRVTYQDLFLYANRKLAGNRVIIANADIFFDATLARLEGYELPGKMLCLSRWDLDPDGQPRFFDHSLSQDAWIFDAPVREFSCGFHLGVPGCDNRLAWEARRAGLVLMNPGRSIRAYHLHASGVRRYSEKQRVAGPTASIPGGFLEEPWLWFIVPCRGRLDDLRRTVNTLLGQPRSTCVVVDYGCPDQAGAWLKEHHPNVRPVTCGARDCFQGAEARNRGAAMADDDGILCFLDADVAVAPEFSRLVLSSIGTGGYLIADREGGGFSNALVCAKRDFDRVGGFDEAFPAWGEEVLDLRAALRRIGLTERTFPAALLSHPEQHHSVEGSIAFSTRDATLAVHQAYRRAKQAFHAQTPDAGNYLALLEDLVTNLQNGAPSCLPSSCASVAFREKMGYTISRLEPGVSSHNNDPRPFAAIPESFTGLCFTQVVANSASPVEVEFLTSGKLYVLVGTDWEGGRAATAWLRESGRRELIPPFETRRGTGFDVWSLAAEVGDRLVLPTQVMLVARHLERR